HTLESGALADSRQWAWWPVRSYDAVDRDRTARLGRRARRFIPQRWRPIQPGDGYMATYSDERRTGRALAPPGRLDRNRKACLGRSGGVILSGSEQESRWPVQSTLRRLDSYHYQRRTGKTIPVRHGLDRIGNVGLGWHYGWHSQSGHGWSL